MYSINPSQMLKNRTYNIFNVTENVPNLAELCNQLIDAQNNSWPELAQAYNSLNNVMTRDVECDGFSVRIQHNPGRMINSVAAVDQKNISERPCFLCPGSFPQEQKGILHLGEYLILCNPRPVFHSHLTVSHINHRPQAIAGNIGMLLQLIADFGTKWTVLYNGPKCGASAPDHLHFQAIPSGLMPIEREVVQDECTNRILCGGVEMFLPRNLGRQAVILEGNEPKTIADVFNAFVNALQGVSGSDEEPMLNLAGFYEPQGWRILIFPRSKHRPDVFFLEGEGRIVVSPAVIEMGGVIVTPVEKDFERLDARMIESMYKEVSLDNAAVEKAVGVIIRKYSK